MFFKDHSRRKAPRYAQGPEFSQNPASRYWGHSQENVRSECFPEVRRGAGKLFIEFMNFSPGS